MLTNIDSFLQDEKDIHDYGDSDEYNPDGDNTDLYLVSSITNSNIDHVMIEHESVAHDCGDDDDNQRKVQGITRMTSVAAHAGKTAFIEDFGRLGDGDSDEGGENVQSNEPQLRSKRVISATFDDALRYAGGFGKWHWVVIWFLVCFTRTLKTLISFFGLYNSVTSLAVI